MFASIAKEKGIGRRNVQPQGETKYKVLQAPLDKGLINSRNVGPWEVDLRVGNGAKVDVERDPKYWTYRPLSEQMIRAAADDVRFLLYIYHKMVQKLNDKSLWHLAVRGALYCRCFCINDDHFADWPPLPPIPENIVADESIPEEEILSVLDVPPGKMGRVIGRKGASILSIKKSCNAEIFIGGAKGPPDKVFIIGPVKQARKAEAILRGKLLDF